MKRVLFVNGVNTHGGGASAYTLRLWTRILAERESCRVWHLTPAALTRGPAPVYKAVLALLYLPGTLFRALRNPVFEFLYKLSPIQLGAFLGTQAAYRPDQVVLSHHAAFFLGAFVSRAKRVFLIQDLLYARAKSMGFSRAATRAVFRIELWVYRRAPLVLVLSAQERRLLSRFLKPAVRVKLISSYDFSKRADGPSGEVAPDRSVALIADWRRFENVDGVREFFTAQAASGSRQAPAKLKVRIWGYQSEGVERLLRERGPSSIEPVNCGGFDHYTEVTDPFIFVPIFIGAGIKIKVLEALAHGKGVIGTRAAFIGLPPALVSRVVVRIRTLDDLLQARMVPPAQAEFERFRRDYAAAFEDIHRAIEPGALTSARPSG